MYSKKLIKNFFLLIFIFTINNNCYSQQVIIKIKNNNDISHYNKKVYLIAYHKNDYYNEITKIDSSSIINGVLNFNIKNLDKKPYPFFLKFDHDIISYDFYIDSLDNQFIIDTLYFRFTPISLKKNSANNERIEYENSNKYLKNNFLRSIDSLKRLIKDNKRTPQQIDYIVKLRDKYATDQIITFEKFVKLHPNSYYCFWELVNLHYGQGYKSEFENIFNILDVTIRNSYVGKLFLSDLMQSKETAINQSFKAVLLKNNNLENVLFDVAKIKKKIILVDYWYSQCAPCISQFDDLNKIYSTYNELGFEIVGISTDKKKDINNWKQVISEKRLKWEQYIDINAADAKLKSINKYPTNFLINEDGVIIKKDISLIDLEKFLQQNLKE
jgi:peroxiredoxin